MEIVATTSLPAVDRPTAGMPPACANCFAHSSATKNLSEAVCIQYEWEGILYHLK